jgi:hypothetical protein
MDHALVIAFQNYVRTYSPELFSQLFYGFKTASLATIHQGLKGEHVVTESIVSSNLARRHRTDFDAVTAFTLKPEKLITVLNKVDFKIAPQDYEKSYAGAWRQRGQNPEDWPLAAFCLEQVIEALQQEYEVAVWQGDEAAVPAAGDFLRQTFDGYLKQIADAITATDLTPVATGALSSANIIAKLRDMYALVPTAYKERGFDIYMSYGLFDTFRMAYKDAYKVDPAYVEIANSTYQGIRYELGNGNATIIPVPGMGTSGRVIMTHRSNLHIGIDDPGDTTMFNMEQEVRELKFWMDFRMGAKMTGLRDGVTVVNDQA